MWYNQHPGPLLAPEPAAALHRPWGSDHEPEHPLSEVLPDVSSQRQACGSLFPLPAGPLPARIPRPRSPELDQGPRLYPELRGPLGAGSPLASGTKAGPELGVSDSRTEGSSGGSGPRPACCTGPARRTSLGLSILHATCVDLSLLSATPRLHLAGVRAWHAGQTVLRCLAPRLLGPHPQPSAALPPPRGRTAEGL